MADYVLKNVKLIPFGHRAAKFDASTGQYFQTSKRPVPLTRTMFSQRLRSTRAPTGWKSLTPTKQG